jgi:glycosyltransferase involved in cell wall biosynthesis
VDDGSSDASIQIIRGIQDKRLSLLTQSNQGAHAAINRGLRQAQGDYLAILNSDDIFHPTRLEKLAACLQADPGLGLAASAIQIINQSGEPQGIKHGYRDQSPWPLEDEAHSFRASEDLGLALLTENYLGTTSNYVFTRRCYETVGEFLPLRYVHDWDFSLRACRSFSLHLEAEPLLSYRVHPKNTIRENQAAMIFELCWILARHLPVQAAQPGQPLPVLPLLNSIYVYGFERVLAGLLVERIDQRLDKALELLQPGNPAREDYLAFIRAGLLRSAASAAPAPVVPPSLARLIFNRFPTPLQNLTRRVRRLARR